MNYDKIRDLKWSKNWGMKAGMNEYKQEIKD